MYIEIVGPIPLPTLTLYDKNGWTAGFPPIKPGLPTKTTSPIDCSVTPKRLLYGPSNTLNKLEYELYSELEGIR